MSVRPVLTAIGLMSGTSLDGVDAALVRTDGMGRVEPDMALTIPYDGGLRERLRACLGESGDDPAAIAAGRELSLVHAAAVAALLQRVGMSAKSVDVIGFHGQTISHDPARRRTVQIGDGDLLAAETGIDVVDQFRIDDVAAGGEGAPLVPVYHAALAAPLERPVAILNIGGVANVTWVGEGEDPHDLGNLLAFDTGPGVALIDDWTLRHTGQRFDRDGSLARLGRVRAEILDAFLSHDYFAVPPPKSLDRNAFATELIDRLDPADGCATLVAFTAHAAAAAGRFFPGPVRRWLVTGGGRLNPALMAALGEILSAPVQTVDAVGWNGDALEAQAFAYLAVRSLAGLPLTFPSTTGVDTPQGGGRLRPAPRKAGSRR